MQFIQLPAFNDNYIWLVEEANRVWVVDPGDASVVINYLDSHAMILEGILITHHHKDHIGGIAELSEWSQRHAQTPLQIYGPSLEEIPFRTHSFSGAETVTILQNLLLQVIDVGGHTKGHIAYFAPNTLPPRVFCGDTLFAAGCGRIFEGTPSQMFSSLNRLAALPKETLVCCAHEYTLSNLRFAQSVEPKNQQLDEWVNTAKELRAKNIPTVPTTIGLELTVNPFLRCQENEVIESAQTYTGTPLEEPLEVFTVLRGWKDVFK